LLTTNRRFENRPWLSSFLFQLGNGGDIELRGIFAIWSDTAFSCAELRLIQDRHAHAMGEQLSTLKSTDD